MEGDGEEKRKRMMNEMMNYGRTNTDEAGLTQERNCSSNGGITTTERREDESSHTGEITIIM